MKMKRITIDDPVIGVFGIGLAAYWPQFDGLEEALVGSRACLILNLLT